MTATGAGRLTSALERSAAGQRVIVGLALEEEVWVPAGPPAEGGADEAHLRAGQPGQAHRGLDIGHVGGGRGLPGQVGLGRRQKNILGGGGGWGVGERAEKPKAKTNATALRSQITILYDTTFHASKCTLTVTGY